MSLRVSWSIWFSSVGAAAGGSAASSLEERNDAVRPVRNAGPSAEGGGGGGGGGADCSEPAPREPDAFDATPISCPSAFCPKFALTASHHSPNPSFTRSTPPRPRPSASAAPSPSSDARSLADANVEERVEDAVSYVEEMVEEICERTSWVAVRTPVKQR